MVTDLEERGVKIFIAAKPTPSLLGYISFAARSVRLARRKDLDLLQAEYIPHSSLIPALLGRRTVPIILKFHGDDARIFPFKNRGEHGADQGHDPKGRPYRYCKRGDPEDTH